MKKVYIAGMYSADNVLDVLRNIGRGEHMAARLFLLGFAPFCPWHDKDFIIKNPNEHYNVEMFYNYSMAWLEVSDCMLLLDGWEKSKGTALEIQRATELDIPIFHSVEELLKDNKIETFYHEDVKPIKFPEDGIKVWDPNSTLLSHIWDQKTIPLSYECLSNKQKDETIIEIISGIIDKVLVKCLEEKNINKYDQMLYKELYDFGYRNFKILNQELNTPDMYDRGQVALGVLIKWINVLKVIKPDTNNPSGYVIEEYER